MLEMVSVKEYYTQQGNHCVMVSADPEQWIGYQAKMVCRTAPPWLPPCKESEAKSALVYDISACIPLQTFHQLKLEEIQEIGRELIKIQKETGAYLLDEGGYCTQAKYLFWNPMDKKLQCIYIPSQTNLKGKDWIQKVTAQILGHAIVEKWPEKELLECYRMYRDSHTEEGFRPAPQRQPEEEEPKEERAEEEYLAQEAAKTARLARYALWDSLDDEVEEENIKDTVQKVKGKMKQIFGKKEK